MNQIIGYFKNDGTQIENENKLYIDFDYVQIELIGNHAKDTEDGNIILVSKCDINAVVIFKWYLNSNGYPATYGSYDKVIKYNKPVTLHRMMFGKLNKGYVVDHINRNKLDNRRDNLRICTSLQNSYNKTKPKNSICKYKGVIKTGTTFKSSITMNGMKHEIKNIATEEQAAKIYDMMAEELFGQYAAKNFNDSF